VMWTLGLFVATLVQRRFFHSFALGEALLIGSCFAEVERWWDARADGAGRRWRRAGLAAALALVLLPALASYRPFLTGPALVGPAPGEALPVSPATFQRRVTESLALWLRENTPEAGGWLERDAAPEYGVLAPWEAGHAIEYLGRRPTVIDEFGDDLGPENFARAGRYFASAEPEALAILESLGVRYVVTGPGAVTAEHPGPDSMFRALRVRDGAALEAGAGAPALERHRLVWESPSLAPRDPGAAPLYKVFEVVAGARIEGRASPGEAIALDLALRTGRGRDTRYRARSVADASGRFAFRVPHPAPGGTRDIRALGPYQLRCGGAVLPIRVGEDAVARGAVIQAPRACP